MIAGFADFFQLRLEKFIGEMITVDVNERKLRWCSRGGRGGDSWVNECFKQRIAKGAACDSDDLHMRRVRGSANQLANARGYRGRADGGSRASGEERGGGQEEG